MMADSNQLISQLCNSALYAHETADIRVIETHISWILLTGIYAYKIKKPVQFSFVDFSTLDKRKFYCHEELRLNSRLAPQLYLEVVTITGSPSHPSFQQDGMPIEYAVKMKQFPQSRILGTLADTHQLQQRHIDQLADELAMFHLAIDTVAADDTLGTPEDIHAWATGNVEKIESMGTDHQTTTLTEILKEWSEREYQQHYTRFRDRRNDGFIRECHGDLHLGNIVLIDDHVTVFDGIEFNASLRWIDVMNEMAFLVMDLNAHHYPELANRCLNMYLQHTGDYGGLIVFKYYLVYRALVRAKVCLIRATQENSTLDENKVMQKAFNAYLTLASAFTRKRNNALIITFGLSGSGKSTYAALLAQAVDAIHIRSDIERKRLHGYAANELTASDLNSGIYTLEASAQTYQRLADIAQDIIVSEYSVIVDASFLQRAQRGQFQALAEKLQVAFIVLHFDASTETLKERITVRARERSDPSEADIEVLNNQMKKLEPVGESEQSKTIVINTEKQIQTPVIVNRILSVAQSYK